SALCTAGVGPASGARLVIVLEPPLAGTLLFTALTVGLAVTTEPAMAEVYRLPVSVAVTDSDAIGTAAVPKVELLVGLLKLLVEVCWSPITARVLRRTRLIATEAPAALCP